MNKYYNPYNTILELNGAQKKKAAIKKVASKIKKFKSTKNNKKIILSDDRKDKIIRKLKKLLKLKKRIKKPNPNMQTLIPETVDLIEMSKNKKSGGGYNDDDSIELEEAEESEEEQMEIEEEEEKQDDYEIKNEPEGEKAIKDKWKINFLDDKNIWYDEAKKLKSKKDYTEFISKNVNKLFDNVNFKQTALALAYKQGVADNDKKLYEVLGIPYYTAEEIQTLKKWIKTRYNNLKRYDKDLETEENEENIKQINNKKENELKQILENETTLTIYTHKNNILKRFTDAIEKGKISTFSVWIAQQKKQIQNLNNKLKQKDDEINKIGKELKEEFDLKITDLKKWHAEIMQKMENKEIARLNSEKIVMDSFMKVKSSKTTPARTTPNKKIEGLMWNFLKEDITLSKTEETQLLKQLWEKEKRIKQLEEQYKNINIEKDDLNQRLNSEIEKIKNEYGNKITEVETEKKNIETAAKSNLKNTLDEKDSLDKKLKESTHKLKTIEDHQKILEKEKQKLKEENDDFKAPEGKLYHLNKQYEENQLEIKKLRNVIGEYLQKDEKSVLGFLKSKFGYTDELINKEIKKVSEKVEKSDILEKEIIQLNKDIMELKKITNPEEYEKLKTTTSEHIKELEEKLKEKEELINQKSELIIQKNKDLASNKIKNLFKDLIIKKTKEQGEKVNKKYLEKDTELLTSGTKLKELKDKYEITQKEINDIKNKVKKLPEEFEKIKTSIKTTTKEKLKEQLSKNLDAEMVKKAEEINQLKTEFAKEKKELEDAKKKLEKTIEGLEKADEQIKQEIKNIITHNDETLKAQKVITFKKEEEIKKLKSNIEEKDSEINQLKGQLENATKKEKSEINEQIIKLESEKTQLTEQINKLIDTNKTITQLKDATIEEVKKLKNDLEDTNQKIKTYKIMEEQYEKTKLANPKLTKDLNDTNEKYQTLKLKHESLDAHTTNLLKQSNEEKTNLEKEIKELKEKISSSINLEYLTIESQKDEITQLNKKLENNNVDALKMADNELEINTLKTQLTNKENELTDLIRKMEVLNKENEYLKQPEGFLSWLKQEDPKDKILKEYGELIRKKTLEEYESQLNEDFENKITHIVEQYIEELKKKENEIYELKQIMKNLNKNYKTPDKVKERIEEFAKTSDFIIDWKINIHETQTLKNNQSPTKEELIEMTKKSNNDDIDELDKQTNDLKDYHFDDINDKKDWSFLLTKKYSGLIIFIGDEKIKINNIKIKNNLSLIIDGLFDKTGKILPKYTNVPAYNYGILFYDIYLNYDLYFRQFEKHTKKSVELLKNNRDYFGEQANKCFNFAFGSLDSPENSTKWIIQQIATIHNNLVHTRAPLENPPINPNYIPPKQVQIKETTEKVKEIGEKIDETKTKNKTRNKSIGAKKK